MSERISHHDEMCIFDTCPVNIDHVGEMCIDADGKTRERRVAKTDERVGKQQQVIAVIEHVSAAMVAASHDRRPNDRRQGQRRVASQVAHDPFNPACPCELCFVTASGGIPPVAHEMHQQSAPVSSVEAVKRAGIGIESSCAQDLPHLRTVSSVESAAKKGITFSDDGLKLCREICEREMEQNPENFAKALTSLGIDPDMFRKSVASSPVPKLVEALRKARQQFGTTQTQHAAYCAAEDEDSGCCCGLTETLTVMDEALSDYDSHSLAGNEKGRI